MIASLSSSFRSRVLRGLLMLAAAALWVGGCSEATTDTGYQPHRLDMNGSQIRALYAPAFSPEAQASKDEQRETMHNMHAGPGGY